MASDWIDPKNPGAFSGVSLFHKSNPNISRNEIKQNVLPSIPTYQKFRGKKLPQVYNPYFVRKKRKVIQSDLLHMMHPPSMKKDNDGYTYILVVQDIFSRKVWALPLRNKTADSVIEKLTSILRQMKPFKKNARFIIDRGTEYLNKKVKTLLEKQNMSITHPSDGHASHVERVILSLQRILYQYIENEGGKKLNWIKFLPNAVSIINNRYHRIIKMSPNQAEEKKNESKVNEAMSIYRQKAFIKQQKRKKQPSPFKINDFVRIQKWKNKFSRGYEQNYTTEVFRVSKILAHLPITMYTVSDLENQKILGNFYAEELSAVKGDVFLVEKIVDRKKIRNIKHVLVKWEGFPSSYNTWEKESSII